MSIPKKGGYSGGRPASEMGPPTNLPSESTATTAADFRQMWADAECQANERAAMLGTVERLADEYGWKVNDPDVPFEARKVYAKVMRDLFNALSDPYTNTLHGFFYGPSPEFRAAAGDLAGMAGDRAMHVDVSPEDRQRIADLCDQVQGATVDECSVSIHTLTCAACLGEGPCRECRICSCGRPLGQHPPGPPCPPPPPPGVPHG